MRINIKEYQYQILGQLAVDNYVNNYDYGENPVIQLPTAFGDEALRKLYYGEKFLSQAKTFLNKLLLSN